MSKEEMVSSLFGKYPFKETWHALGDLHLPQETSTAFMNSPYDQQLVLNILEWANTNFTESLTKEYKNLLANYPDKQFADTFYIYICKKMMDRYPKESSLKVQQTIKALYYELEVALDYEPDLFKTNLEDSAIDYPKIAKETKVNKEIEEYIANHLPATITDKLELSIAIYLLLGDFLKYNVEFLIDHDYQSLDSVETISLKKNEIMCKQYAICCYILFQKYQIDAALRGKLDKHVFVTLAVGIVMANADATLFLKAADPKDYKLSDLANIKFGFPIENFYVNPSYYQDKQYVKQAQEKVNHAIKAVYQKLNRSQNGQERMNRLITKVKENITRRNINKKSQNQPIHDKREIEYRISILNYFYHLNVPDAHVEKNQFFSKYSPQLFFDFSPKEIQILTFSKRTKENHHLLVKALQIQDDEQNPYFYLESEFGFQEVSYSFLVKEIRANHLDFFHPENHISDHQRTK